MKGFIVLAIFGVAVSYAALGAEIAVPADTDETFKPQCPEVDGQNVTLIGNPSNCTTYFACDRGSPVPMMCPGGLHFNDAEKACDWPEKACCDISLNRGRTCPNTA